MIATEEDLKFERFLRNREAKKLVWKTKTGEVVLIQDLDDNHLDNIINLRNKMIKDGIDIKSDIFNFY